MPRHHAVGEGSPFGASHEAGPLRDLVGHDHAVRGQFADVSVDDTVDRLVTGEEAVRCGLVHLQRGLEREHGDVQRDRLDVRYFDDALDQIELSGLG